MKRTLTTADQAVQRVFNLLKPLKADVSMSGVVFPYNRPISSNTEDVVISALTLNADQQQNGMLNVNIHIPNLQLGGDNTQPNRVRFQVISNRAIELLDYHDGFDFTLTLDNAGELIRDGEFWFMNIRVRYNSIRLENN